jgi:hypothetical protein
MIGDVTKASEGSFMSLKLTLMPLLLGIGGTDGYRDV